jgi:hypothetical protein
MNLIKWYLDRILATQKLPLKEYFLFFLGKILGGFAIGLLLASYLTEVDWASVGWIVLVVALLISVPAMPKILK